MELVDLDASGKVMEAMLAMTKLEVSLLEAA